MPAILLTAILAPALVADLRSIPPLDDVTNSTVFLLSDSSLDDVTNSTVFLLGDCVLLLGSDRLDWPHTQMSVQIDPQGVRQEARLPSETHKEKLL